MPRKRTAATPLPAPRPSTPSGPLTADGNVSDLGNVAASTDDAESPEADAPAVLQDAWDAVCPAAEALPMEAIVRPNVPVREAALLGRRVADAVVADAKTLHDFEALGATPFFEVRYLHELPLLARGLLYVRAHVDSNASSSVAVPTPLIEQAKALQTGMLKVLGFYFDAETAVGAELARIRAATGHAALASGLVSLSTLYTKHGARIRKTPEFYVATDARDAAGAAESIYRHLATPPVSEDRWREQQGRLWTLFFTAYTEVCAAGRFMYRGRADLDARFPALTSLNVARRGPAKKAHAKPEPTDPK